MGCYGNSYVLNIFSKSPRNVFFNGQQTILWLMFALLNYYFLLSVSTVTKLTRETCLALWESCVESTKELWKAVEY